MPVSSTYSPNSYTGNSVATVFAYTFRVISSADVLVTVDGVTKTLGGDYSVSGVGASGGGNVTFSVAPTTGAKVVISRNVTFQRTTDFVDNGDLRASTLDDDQDIQTMLIQQVQANVDRSIRVPLGETLSDLPSSTLRASKLLGFDSSGNATSYALTDLSAVVVTAFASTFLDDVSAAEASNTITGGALTLDGSLNPTISGPSTITLKTATNTRMTIDASGNAVIGSTSIAGSRSLVVVNASASASANAGSYVQTDAGVLQMVLGSTASGATASLFSSSAGVMNVYTTAAATLQLGTNNVPGRLTIDTSGNVNAAVSLSENGTRAFSRNSSSLCGGAQTYDAANKVFTFPHGLGQIPTWWYVWAVCLNGTANTGGAAYPAGHVIAIVNNQSTSMISVTMDTTNIYLRVAGNIAVADFTTPSSIVALVAGAKWSLNVRAGY